MYVRIGIDTLSAPSGL